MRAELKLAGSEVNAFGKDIHDLVLEVEYQSQQRKLLSAYARSCEVVDLRQVSMYTSETR